MQSFLFFITSFLFSACTNMQNISFETKQLQHQKVAIAKQKTDKVWQQIFKPKLRNREK